MKKYSKQQIIHERSLPQCESKHPILQEKTASRWVKVSKFRSLQHPQRRREQRSELQARTNRSGLKYGDPDSRDLRHPYPKSGRFRRCGWIRPSTRERYMKQRCQRHQTSFTSLRSTPLRMLPSQGAKRWDLPLLNAIFSGILGQM